MTETADVKRTAQTVVATIRSIHLPGANNDLADLARDVEAWAESYDPTEDLCCPLCQEMQCDPHCPLKPVRNDPTASTLRQKLTERAERDHNFVLLHPEAAFDVVREHFDSKRDAIRQAQERWERTEVDDLVGEIRSILFSEDA